MTSLREVPSKEEEEVLDNSFVSLEGGGEMGFEEAGCGSVVHLHNYVIVHRGLPCS